jgi:hypothetical protein
MRLLNSSTLVLHEFISGRIPRYAILSHTWSEEEVSFQDIRGPGAVSRKGFEKVRKRCEQAARDGYEWVWIDTCCIDKSSSSELSEAINSMYQWYKNAQVCYAYLADVPSRAIYYNADSFVDSRWFQRGWTLH